MTTNANLTMVAAWFRAEERGALQVAANAKVPDHVRQRAKLYAGHYKVAYEHLDLVARARAHLPHPRHLLAELLSKLKGGTDDAIMEMYGRFQQPFVAILARAERAEREVERLSKALVAAGGEK